MRITSNIRNIKQHLTKSPSQPGPDALRLSGTVVETREVPSTPEFAQFKGWVAVIVAQGTDQKVVYVSGRQSGKKVKAFVKDQQVMFEVVTILGMLVARNFVDLTPKVDWESALR